MRKLLPSQFSYGGVRGRSIKGNAAAHANSTFAFGADISDFYPSISRNRVYRLFSTKLDCSPDVSRICTMLCTHRHRLELGLVTSPFLADQILIDVDRQIANACENEGLVYTRFVDDITISGPFDLSRSGFPDLVGKILDKHGFELNPEKNRFGRISKRFTITKISLHNGYPDVERQYLLELERQIEDIKNLGTGGEFVGPYFLRSQLLGRIQFVCWVNPRRKRALYSRFKGINWLNVEREAERRGYVALRPKLVPKERAEKRPSAEALDSSPSSECGR